MEILQTQRIFKSIGDLLELIEWQFWQLHLSGLTEGILLAILAFIFNWAIEFGSTCSSHIRHELGVHVDVVDYGIVGSVGVRIEIGLHLLVKHSVHFDQIIEAFVLSHGCAFWEFLALRMCGVFHFDQWSVMHVGFAELNSSFHISNAQFEVSLGSWSLIHSLWLGVPQLLDFEEFLLSLSHHGKFIFLGLGSLLLVLDH